MSFFRNLTRSTNQKNSRERGRECREYGKKVSIALSSTTKNVLNKSDKHTADRSFQGSKSFTLLTLFLKSDLLSHNGLIKTIGKTKRQSTYTDFKS